MRPEILIVGGGIIGVCSAYYLAEQGWQVTIIDKGDICRGASYGNAGLISPSHCIPLAAPGVITKAIKWMFDQESPFYIKPRVDLELWLWLWRFYRACNDNIMHKSMPVLWQLGQSSTKLFEQLANLSGLNFGYQPNGCLHLFKNARDYEVGIDEARLLNELGIDSEVLSPEGVRKLEPNTGFRGVGGIYFAGDAHLIPHQFVQGLARICEEMGVKIKKDAEVIGFKTSGRMISKVETTRGDFRSDCVVLAGGAWFPALSRMLGIPTFIQAAKGYSITVKKPDVSPSIPLILSEAKVAVTPMGETMRFAGTLELTGMDMSITRRRVEAILREVHDYLNLSERQELIEIWRGLRPCTPDGLPVIGRSMQLDNLVVAGGHATLGVSLGPVTGKLVSQIVTNTPPLLDLAPLRLERFSFSKHKHV
jgi:D-amino-acid dehydrogenase